MNNTRNTLKTVGIVNSIIICVSICLVVSSIVDVFKTMDINPFYLNVISIIGAIALIVALIFGFIYSYNGYTKDFSKYYKGYMILLALSAIIDIVCTILSGLEYDSLYNVFSLLSIIGRLIITICYNVLGFKLDYGDSKSSVASYISLGTCFVLFGLSIVAPPVLGLYKITFGHLLISYITSVFVNAKYTDKKMRGTK